MKTLVLEPVPSTLDCYCDYQCEEAGDCCDDYHQSCSSSSVEELYSSSTDPFSNGSTPSGSVSSSGSSTVGEASGSCLGVCGGKVVAENCFLHDMYAYLYKFNETSFYLGQNILVYVVRHSVQNIFDIGVADGGCRCDVLCVYHSDCCGDFEEMCETCVGTCTLHFSAFIDDHDL